MDEGGTKISGLIRNIWQKFNHPTYARTVSVLAILIIVAAVPLTVFVAQQRQNFSSRASDSGQCTGGCGNCERGIAGEYETPNPFPEGQPILSCREQCREHCPLCNCDQAPNVCQGKRFSDSCGNFEACTGTATEPNDCSGHEDKCTTETFLAPNGCEWRGTKDCSPTPTCIPTCIGADTHCMDFSDGCGGTCHGTKFCCPGNVPCNDDVTYCDINRLIHKHGRCDGSNCVYVFDPVGSCGNGNSTPTPTLAPTGGGNRPAPTNTPAPTPIPSPTPTPDLNSTYLNLNLGLIGIGALYDIPGGKVPANTNLRHPSREATVQIYRPDNTLINTYTGTITYNYSTKKFEGKINLGAGFATGNYKVKVKTPKYLRRLIGRERGATTQTITNKAGANNPNENSMLANLIPGDIVDDNEVNAADYNLYLGCFGSSDSGLCGTNKEKIDINDDGITDSEINMTDYVLLIYGFGNRAGD